MNARLSDTTLWLAGGLIWLLLVSSASLMPLDLPAPAAAAFSDKLGHLVVYAAIGVWFAAHPLGWGFLLLALGVGLELEWLQHLTGYRQAEALDWLADAVGLALGWFVGRLIWPRFQLDLRR